MIWLGGVLVLCDIFIFILLKNKFCIVNYFDYNFYSIFERVIVIYLNVYNLLGDIIFVCYIFILWIM